MIITPTNHTRLSAAIFSLATCLVGCAPLPPAIYRVGNNPASMTAAEAQQELIRTALEPQITPPLDAPLQLVRVVLPEYPLGSLRSGVEGKVRLTFRVLGDGTVDQVKVVESPNDELSAAARDAVAQWKFSPVTRNGAGATLKFAFTYRFELGVTPSR